MLCHAIIGEEREEKKKRKKRGKNGRAKNIFAFATTFVPFAYTTKEEGEELLLHSATIGSTEEG